MGGWSLTEPNRLDRLASALLEHETLDEADAYRIAGIERERRPMPEDVPTAAAATNDPDVLTVA